MVKDRKLFLASDVDGTLFNTLDKRPGFVSVEEACLRAVEQAFGSPALKAYESIGFLQNREPRELVTVLGGAASDMGIKMGGYRSVKDATDAFVEHKLSHMLPQISRDWPLPYEGVVDFLRESQTGEIPVEVGVISSGHDYFIAKAFEVNGLTPPQFTVTSDATRHLIQPRVPKFKPFTYQMAVLHKKVEGQIKDPDDQTGGVFLERSEFKLRTAYIGDDPRKDLGLAHRSRVVGILVSNVYPDFQPEAKKGQIRIDDFNELKRVVEASKEEIAKGVTWSDILLGISDQEVFGNLDEGERPYSRWLKNPLDASVKGLFP